MKLASDCTKEKIVEKILTTLEARENMGTNVSEPDFIAGAGTVISAVFSEEDDKQVPDILPVGWYILPFVGRSILAEHIKEKDSAEGEALQKKKHKEWAIAHGAPKMHNLLKSLRTRLVNRGEYPDDEWIEEIDDILDNIQFDR